MIVDGEFATPVVVCKATCGVCFKESKCGTCESARKYTVNKKFFEMVESCRYRIEDDVCGCSLQPCLRGNCSWMLEFVEMLVL
jgi:hypothetical protein